MLADREPAVTPQEELDRLRLARSEDVGPVTYRRLLARFATAEEAIEALPGPARAGGRADAPRVPGRDEAARELDRLARLGGRMVFLGGADYPPLLALLADAPSVIAVLGDVGCLAARAVALVGARNCSTNGERMAEALSTDLAASGLVVVSGLARGIDAAAHRGAMHVGHTVACVAGGLDRPYPAEHAALQAEVAAHGAVVAEAALGMAPQNRHFPRRNRIIAGLSLGVVVVEAALRSGTLITARLAQELHREIFAVPGSPLDPRSRGANDLIRQGAFLTESAADVLANLPDHGPALLAGRGAEAGRGDEDADADRSGGGASRAVRQRAGTAGTGGTEAGGTETGRTEADGTKAGPASGADADEKRAGTSVSGAGGPEGTAAKRDAAEGSAATAQVGSAGVDRDEASAGGSAEAPASDSSGGNVPAPPHRRTGLLRRRAAAEPAPDRAEDGAPMGDAEGAGGEHGAPDGVQARVLATLSLSPTPVDEVVRRCHLSASAVSAALLELELAGRIETLPGNRVSLLIDTGP